MKHSTPLLWAISLGSSALTLPALANEDDLLADLSLEALLDIKVSTASLREEKLEDAPGIISIITRREIATYHADNLMDLLTMLPSVANISFARFRNNSVGIRGHEFTQYATHVLFLLDGRPVRDGITGGIMSPVINGMPLTSIEQIEVIRGPGSVLYGSNAFAGVINIKTRKATDGVEGNVNLSAGSFGTQEIDSGIYFNEGDFNGSVALKYRDSDGENFGFSDRNGRVFSPDWYEKDRGITANLNYGDFGVKLASFRRDNYSMQSGFRWRDPIDNNHDVLRHDVVDLSYSSEIFEGHTFSAFYTLNKTDWQRSISASIGGDSEIVELRMAGNITDKIDYVVGALQDNIETTPTTSVTPSDKTNRGIYWQSSYFVNEDLKLIGGMQWNKPDGLSGEVSPRLGAIYHATEALSFKVLYGEAFRASTALDTAVETAALTSNDQLAPETVSTTDISVNYKKDNWSMSATYYRSELDDLFVRRLVPGSDTQNQVVNGEGFQFTGFELEGRIVLTNGINWFANASWQSNEDDASGVEDRNGFPDAMVKSGLSYNDERYSSSLFASYINVPQSPNDIALNTLPENYVMVSASFGMEIPELIDGARIRFSGDNLLGEDIYFPEYHRFVLGSVRLHADRAFRADISITF